MTLKERIEYAEKRYEANREAKISDDFWMGYVAGLKAHLADLEEEKAEKEGN